MDRERGGENERTNLLNENKKVNRNKIFTFTKYRHENEVSADSSSSEQNHEDVQQFRQKKPNVVRKLEDDFKVYRSHSNHHQSKTSTPSKKGSWWKWGQSDDRKLVSTESASRISCACKRLMCSDYVVMFILTVFFTFSTLLGLVIIFKAFPSLVIVPADDHVRLNRKVDRLTQLHTDGLIDGSLARNSKVGLKSSDYRSWNNPIPTEYSVNLRGFDDINNADVRESNQFPKPENDNNNDFYKKLLRTAERFRKIKQTRDNNHRNDFVSGDMNRYKRSIRYPPRKYKRHFSPNHHYYNKIPHRVKIGNKKASTINKRQSGEPMGVVIEKNKMVLQFLGPQDSKTDGYQKPYYFNKHQHKPINDKSAFKEDHHFMDKKFTDTVPNGAFSDMLRKGKEKFNHFLNHKNGYDFNPLDHFDNSQFNYLKRQELKDLEINSNKEDSSPDIEKDKLANEKVMSNEDPLVNSFNEDKRNPTTRSSTESTHENTERSTETTLEVKRSTGAAMEKVPILRKLLQFDENYHESEDYDNVKTSSKILMHPDLVDRVIFIEANNADDKIQDTQNNDNDVEINVGVFNDNFNSLADVEAAIIAEDRQANLNDNYGAVEIDVDGGNYELLQAYSDYGILKQSSNIGYKDKTKGINAAATPDDKNVIKISKARNKTAISEVSVNGISKEIDGARSAKKTMAEPHKNVNRLNNGIFRRKLLAIKTDHSERIDNALIPDSLNADTAYAANNTIANKNIPKTKLNTNITENNTAQVIDSNKNTTATNKTKTVSKRDVPIFDKDLIFWDDIYDDVKSTSKTAVDSREANVNSVNLPQNSNGKSNFAEWISNKLNNVVENIKNGMQREPIKTNLKIHEATRTVRDAKILNNTNDRKGESDKENRKNKSNIKREVREPREVNSFAELEQNMKRICKEAVKAVEDIKNINVNNKEKHGADGYLNNLLMGQLVSLMSELVDFQVEQKTCLKLPPDLREFLIWLTSATETNNKQDLLKNELDELQLHSDLLTSHKPSEPEPRLDQTSSSSDKEDGHAHARSECLGTLEDVQELMQEYQSLPDSEKHKMAGVKEYLEKQLDYLYKRLEEIQDLNTLPVLYTDPLLLRKRRNHPRNREKRGGANKKSKLKTGKNKHKKSNHNNSGKNKTIISKKHANGLQN